MACADTMIRKSDIVLAILSADRWDSQTGQSARDAVALGLPLLVIDPALPGQPLLHRKDGIAAATDPAIADMVRGLLDRRFPNDIVRAKAALSAGDFLTALDLLRHAPDDPGSGAAPSAIIFWCWRWRGRARRAWGWSVFAKGWRAAPGAFAADMARDIAALEARCLKDIALEAHADARREALIEAADAMKPSITASAAIIP